MNVLCPHTDDPHHSLITQFFHREFPQRLCTDHVDFIDLLTAELIGTKQIRLGPKPSPESQVAIRDVLRYYTSRQLPIPIMVPWGSEKPDGSGVDVAEMMALKQLADLQRRVCERYASGLEIRIRLEDASAPHLFEDRQEQAREEAARYTQGFVALVRILGIQGFITPVPESSLITEGDFNLVADRCLPVLERALELYDEEKPDDAAKLLETIGWKGGISFTSREHYMDSYLKLYPGKDHAWKRKRLARYFAGVRARYILKIRGDKPEWEGRFIDLSFVAPIPGTSQVFQRRVYYRTLPLEQSSNHIAPWRAKGYLAIGEEDDIKVKLASYSQLPADLRPMQVKLSDTHGIVSVAADYLLQ